MPEVSIDFDPRPFLLGGLGLVVVASALAFRFRARLGSSLGRLDRFFTPQEVPAFGLTGSLFLASFAALFVEVMMIRWLGTEVRIFAYFQNLALIACFLGFGVGCYWSERRKSALLSVGTMTALVVLVQAPLRFWERFLVGLSDLLSLSPDAALWGHMLDLGRETEGLLFVASLLTVAALLILLVLAMVPLGQWVGKTLNAATDPVSAYTTNLLGSVAGIWVFAGMALLWLSPEYWFALAFLVLLVVQVPSRRLILAVSALLALSLLLLRRAPAPDEKVYWSPYQKIALQDLGDQQYEINVNNTGYMEIANATPEYLAREPEIARRFRGESAYDAPFRFAQHTDRVLIVGAGAGNDAAGALRNRARQVDAVEIDPVILHLGENLHPEQPYASPRVNRVLNDARAFLRQTQEDYDVIIFGLLDSHTEYSGYSNLRIDNYVYTEEAFREAKRLLKPDGVLILKFEVRPPWTWMGQRLYALLDRVFGRPPVVFYAPRIGRMVSATVFVTSIDPNLWARASRPGLAQLVASKPAPFPKTVDPRLPLTTDDWPYIYHRTRTIPVTYLIVSVILLVLAVLFVRPLLEPTRVSTWLFFLLGAGFLLLETQLVSRLALYFGTTWWVNCVALTALLLVLVLANLYVIRFRPARLGGYFILLLAFLIANYFFPWPRLPYGAHTVGVLLSVSYALPVFFAGVIFTEKFRRSERKSNAFGANVVGAVAGGLGQNLSFMIGMKALLLLAALFYAGAALADAHVGPRALETK